MSSAICPRCKVQLRYGFASRVFPDLDPSWYGCPNCGADVCGPCGRELGRQCPSCDTPMELNRRFPTHVSPVGDWREAMQSLAEIGVRLDPGRYVLSMTLDSLPEIDRALPEEDREEFWERIIDLEIERRLGSLDCLETLFGGEARVGPDYHRALASAAAWLVAEGRTDGSALAQMEIASGLRRLGRLAAGVPDVLGELALSPNEWIGEAIRSVLRELGPSARAVLPALGTAIRSGVPERSFAALVALACLHGEFCAVEPREELSEIVLSALRRANDAALDAVVDDATRSRSAGFLAAVVKVMGLEAELLRWLIAELASSEPRRVDKAIFLVPALGPSAAEAEPTLRELAKAGTRQSRNAKSVLRQLQSGPAPADRYAQAWKKVRDGVGTPRSQVEILGDLSDPNLFASGRTTLVLELAQLASPATPGPLVPLLDILCDGAEDGSIRCSAAQGVARAGLPDDLAPRVEPLLEDPRACVRAWAFLLLPEDGRGERRRKVSEDPSAFVRFVASNRERLIAAHPS